VQFRRIEKFYRNYYDAGKVVEELAEDDGEKFIQELEYFDGSIFRGEMERDEETLMMYKEGYG
jgi:hypothetical protein